jgi:hypothetical protein
MVNADSAIFLESQQMGCCFGVLVTIEVPFFQPIGVPYFLSADQ